MVTGLLGINKGVAKRHGKGPGLKVYTRENNPVKFWLYTGGSVAFGGVLLIKGIGVIRSKEEED